MNLEALRDAESTPIGKYSEVFEGIDLANQKLVVIKVLKPIKKSACAYITGSDRLADDEPPVQRRSSGS